MTIKWNDTCPVCVFWVLCRCCIIGICLPINLILALIWNYTNVFVFSIFSFWHIYFFFFHNEACNETNSQLEFQSFSSSFKHHCPIRCIIVECIVKDRHSSCSKDEKQQNKCCLYHLWSLSLHILGMVSNTYTPIYISHV